jgi:hypothetical protein
MSEKIDHQLQVRFNPFIKQQNGGTIFNIQP